MTPLSAIRNALGRDDAKPEDSFESFGLDSLEFLEFVLQVQSDLNITIPDEKISNLNTVADLLKVIDELHISA
jgi:acyl carrier protein